MKIFKYVPFIPFILSSISIFSFFQILININFPNKFTFEKTYIIESRIDDTYKYFDTVKRLNLNLYNSNLEKFLINTLKYCYINNIKICAIARDIGDGYLTISFKQFEEFSLVHENKHFEILDQIKNDNLNYLISQLEYLRILEKYTSFSEELISVDVEGFIVNIKNLPVMQIIKSDTEIKEAPILLISILSFIISCIFGLAISIGFKSYLNKGS